LAVARKIGLTGTAHTLVHRRLRIASPGHPQGTLAHFQARGRYSFVTIYALSRLWLPECVRWIASHLRQAFEERFSPAPSPNKARSVSSFRKVSTSIQLVGWWVASQVTQPKAVRSMARGNVSQNERIAEDRMPILVNVRYERFVQELIRGKSRATHICSRVQIGLPICSVCACGTLYLLWRRLRPRP
jgi:hypothetical protein